MNSAYQIFRPAGPQKSSIILKDQVLFESALGEVVSARVRVSLLVTTYNRYDALELVLQTALRQSVAPDQIIVCDDGSNSETSSGLRKLAQMIHSKTSLIHVWQPDSSFRAARVRNLGLSKVSTPYVIMIDGDCLLPYRFVERHLALGQKGWVVAGGRCLLGTELTERCVATKKVDFSTIRSLKLQHLPMGRLRDLGSKKWETARTCNLGMFVSDALGIGGLDESYVGWGREDSDFVVRLMNSGVKIRSARLSAAVAHLYHAPSDRAYVSANEIRFNSTLNDSESWLAAKSSLVDE